MYTFDDQELQAVQKILNSKNLFRYQGGQVQSLTENVEARLATLVGSSKCLMVNSGTNALVLALRLANIGQGDHVLVPSYTFIATVNAVLRVGAVPIVVDINENLSLDIESLKESITPQTKAIIPVHMDGLPNDMHSISSFALKHNLIIIEDVAQALGGSFNGNKLGSFGRYGCFSFNVDKIITCGEGGALTINSQYAGNDFLKALNLHDGPCVLGASYKNQFDDFEVELGESMRVNELQSAILDAQLNKLSSILKCLSKNKNRLVNALENDDIHLLRPVDQAGDCATSLHIIFDDPIGPILASKKLLKENIKAIPILSRPAHSYWDWMKLFKSKNFVNKPENLIEFIDLHENKSFSKSKKILTHSLKYFVNFDLDENEIQNICRLSKA